MSRYWKILVGAAFAFVLLFVVQRMSGKSWIDWLTLVAEFSIALAIYWEVEETRRVNFLSEAFGSSMYAARAEIYQAYIDTDGGSLAEKSEKFCQRLWAEEALRTKCNDQIVHFNKLGYIFRSSFLGGGPLVQWFPHTIVFFWIILKPYILDRQQATGNWWASHYMAFTLTCVRFLVSEPATPLRMHDGDRSLKRDLLVTVDDLRELMKDLESRIASMKRPSVFLR